MVRRVYNYLYRKRQSIPEFIFLAVFFVILFIPVLNISGAQKSDTENRMLAEKPELFHDGELNQQYGQQFDAWFNDRFGGRGAVLKLRANFLMALTPNSGNDRVLFGRDNWLFYKGDNSIDNFMNRQHWDNDMFENALRYLMEIDAWCRENGKRFIYVVAPDKNKVYPEMFPDYISKARPDEYGLGRQFVKYIRENSDISVVYPYDEIMAAKDDGLLYFKGDTHWSNYGAFIAFREIYRTIYGNDFNERKYIKQWKTEHKKNFDLVDMVVGIDATPYQNDIYLNPVFHKNVKVASEKYLNQDNGLVKTQNSSGRYNIFVLRDSFFTALTNYFAQVARKSEMYWTYKMAPEYLDKINAEYDIVILETVERYIPVLARYSLPKE